MIKMVFWRNAEFFCIDNALKNWFYWISFVSRLIWRFNLIICVMMKRVTLFFVCTLFFVATHQINHIRGKNNKEQRIFYSFFCIFLCFLLEVSCFSFVLSLFYNFRKNVFWGLKSWQWLEFWVIFQNFE